MVEGQGDAQAIAKEIQQSLTLALELPVLDVKGIPVGEKDHQREYLLDAEAARFLRSGPAGKLPLEGDYPAVWGTLLSWLFTSRLGQVTGEEDEAEQSRTWIDEWLLGILNLPLINMWVRIVRIPYHYLFPLILLFCLIGAFSLDLAMSSIDCMVIFGVIGYIMKKFDYEPTPLIMGFILGSIMERSLRQALIISHGSFASFFKKPICVVVLSLAAIILITNILPYLRSKRMAVGTGD